MLSPSIDAFFFDAAIFFFLAFGHFRRFQLRWRQQRYATVDAARAAIFSISITPPPLAYAITRCRMLLFNIQNTMKATTASVTRC